MFRSFILGSLAILCLMSCSYKGRISERMDMVEGEYILANRPAFADVDGSFFQAQIVEGDGHWVFSCVLPINVDDNTTLHQFEQELVWSPELADYLFVTLPEKDRELLHADEVVTRFRNGRIEMSLKKRDQSNYTFITYKWRKL